MRAYISLLIYAIFTGIVIIYADCCLNLRIGDWIQLFLLLVMIGVFLLEGIGQILKALKQPKLKIIHTTFIRTRDRGKKVTSTELFFIIKNTGSEEAKDCLLEVNVEGLWGNYYSLPTRKGPFDLYPDKRERIYLCTVDIRIEKVVIAGKKFMPLNKGKTYEIKIRFYGRNFKDKKIHRLRLDLSSGEKKMLYVN